MSNDYGYLWCYVMGCRMCLWCYSECIYTLGKLSIIYLTIMVGIEPTTFGLLVGTGYNALPTEQRGQVGSSV